MLVLLGTAMKQYLVLMGRRTLNGHSIVGCGRSLASIPIPLCALMLLLSACGEPDLRDSKTLSHILAEAVEGDVLQKRGEGLIYVPNESEPYTGWAKEMYDDGIQVKALIHLENGVLTRLVVWHKNGQKQSEGHYENGNKTGLWVVWDENGKIRSERQY